MKTIKEIEMETEKLRKVMREADSSRAKTINTKLVFLKQCKLYLETSPPEDYLKSEEESLKFKIKILDEKFCEWTGGK